MADLIDEQLQKALDELAGVKNATQLEAWRIAYVSTKALKDLMAPLAAAPKDQKRAMGQKLNAVKDQLASGFEAKKAALSAGDAGRDATDVTEPGRRPRFGNRHILMKVVDELTELFGRMGFAVATGPEVEDEFHNFVALNIPESHPARDPLDNFYLTADAGEGDAAGRPRAAGSPLTLLRTQTSTVQIRVMQTQKPPIRVVIPGRVYRPDTNDATHLPMFHQLEALVVDQNVTMVDLKSTIMQFVHAYFGRRRQCASGPASSPSPSRRRRWMSGSRTSGKWIELGGCGMVHPNVFKNCGIDPEEYSGWAFGFGIERIAMRKYGIADIRHFVENDIRFLKQF